MYFMVDNYDSFVYNLSAYMRELGQEVLVRRADEIMLSEIYALQPQESFSLRVRNGLRMP